MDHMARYLDGMDVTAASSPGPDVAVPRVLAALRPHMLDLARDRADGAHSYFVPPDHTALGREALGPDKLLIPEQAVVLKTDGADARRVARQHMHGYLQLPNYVNNLKHLGYGDDDIAGGASDRLVDAIVAWGDVVDIVARIQEHLDAGADHVLLQPLGDPTDALEQLESLAPGVLAQDPSGQIAIQGRDAFRDRHRRSDRLRVDILDTPGENAGVAAVSSKGGLPLCTT
jgi:probable F420-dependent oxidoreductase